MKTIALILGCLLFGVVEMRAQNAPADLKALPILPQPLPSGDILSPAPDGSKWIIASTLAGGAATAPQPNAPPPKPSVTSIAKSGKVYLVESVDSDGKKLTRWKVDQSQATFLPGVTNPVFATSTGGLYYVDFSKSDYPEFSWISAQNYVGMAKLGSGMGLVFKAKVRTRSAQMGLLSTVQPEPSEAIAVVDMNTKRPSLLQVGNEILTYQFTGGGADVSLPPEIKHVFEALQRQSQQASRPPPG